MKHKSSYLWQFHRCLNTVVITSDIARQYQEYQLSDKWLQPGNINIIRTTRYDMGNLICSVLILLNYVPESTHLMGLQKQSQCHIIFLVNS